MNTTKTAEVLGGVCAPAGFKATGLHAGFKNKADHFDLALVLSDVLCATAGVFTRNTFCAAPVKVCREYLPQGFGYSKAMIINAGNANAATGDPGEEAVHNTTRLAAELIGCQASQVLAASTGVIGVPIPENLFAENMQTLVNEAHVDGGCNAAKAIMTTDTHPKEYALSYESADPEYKGMTITIGGMTKGSGMIMPDMATMIAVLTTDAPLNPVLLHEALVEAVNVSFNKVTIDSDTSTNDTCVLMANGCATRDVEQSAKGASGISSEKGFAADSLAYQEFLSALKQVCEYLAREIAADGEGATKLITVKVTGAATEEDADMAARAVANSPLVKTAVFGHDANWGRVAMAIGKSGAHFNQEDVSISILGLTVCEQGLPIPFDEEEALRRFESPEVEISIDLGTGNAQATIWTCDYSHDYITINGDYRT